MIATASAFALHFAHHTFASGFSKALVGVKLVPGELDHTKFFLAHKTSFVLTTDKASGQNTVRNYFLSLHSEVVRLQVTHKLLREPSQLKVRLSASQQNKTRVMRKQIREKLCCFSALQKANQATRKKRQSVPETL